MSLQEDNSNARGSYALLGGAQILSRSSRPALLLPPLVDNLMVVEHQVGAIGHDDAGRPVRVVDVDAVFDERIELLEECWDLLQDGTKISEGSARGGLRE